MLFILRVCTETRVRIFFLGVVSSVSRSLNGRVTPPDLRTFNTERCIDSRALCVLLVPSWKVQ